jgi:hypothetical protein
MKQIVLFISILFGISACNSNKTKVESPNTDSITRTSTAKTQPSQIKKEEHYVNAVASSQPEKKRGWSSAAKGAVIGGAAGAVSGAVVDKRHRVQGAVIGTAVGAGTGYLIGRHKDKKRKRRQ